MRSWLELVELQPVPMDTTSDCPLAVPQSQFIRSVVEMLVTVRGPLIPAVEETAIELVVVPPGPAMPRTIGFAEENVKLCARAASGIPSNATAVKVRISVKWLNLRKVFSPQGSQLTPCSKYFCKVCKY